MFAIYTRNHGESKPIIFGATFLQTDDKLNVRNIGFMTLENEQVKHLNMRIQK